MIYVPMTKGIEQSLRARGWEDLRTQAMYEFAIKLQSYGIKPARPYEGETCIILQKTYRRYEKGPTDYYVEMYMAVYRETIDAYETDDSVIHKDTVLLVIT